MAKEQSSHPSPSVSVVIPVYNRATLVGRAIDSVISQTYSVHEVIVVDDGSSDNTCEVVRDWEERDSRVRLVEQSHQGAPRARNLGVALATGDAIAFQDSDDIWFPGFLAALVPMLEGSTVPFSSFERVSSDGGMEVLPSRRRIHFANHVLRRRNIVTTQTALIPRELLLRFPFDPQMPRLQDWDLWLSMPRHVTFRHTNHVLARQYLQSDSISSNPQALVDGLRMILSKHWRTLLVAPVSLARNALFVMRWERRHRETVVRDLVKDTSSSGGDLPAPAP